LCRYFGLSEGYFLRLQNAYDTLEAKRRIMPQIAKIKPYKTQSRTKAVA
jgi:plasmid maintenance system antidote protein VapI